MTASEPPAKWGADSRGDDDVVCRVEEGRGRTRGSGWALHGHVSGVHVVPGGHYMVTLDQTEIA